MSARRKRKSGGKAAGKAALRRLSLRTWIVLSVLAVGFASVANWFVHHPRKWLDAKCASWPHIVTAPLFWVGNGVGDITDGLGLTGHDAVYEYDEPAPTGEVFFAGAPRRIGPPAPKDIRIIHRGEFAVGWSPSLRHPVWAAYHVTRNAKHPSGRRPPFAKDRTVDSPAPSAYDHSGYDRGHMVPNHAIESRYGTDEQRKTFLMSNITPQSPALNRGVWRDVEHRIADLWTARYGEIWVIVGCVSDDGGEKLSGTDIDVPHSFYQVIVAQEGLDVRAMAMIFGQDVSWREWAARNLISIDDLERLTGLDFLPDLPEFIQNPLEAELPSRLWPVRWQDILRQTLLRFN